MDTLVWIFMCIAFIQSLLVAGLMVAVWRINKHVDILWRIVIGGTALRKPLQYKEENLVNQEERFNVGRAERRKMAQAQLDATREILAEIAQTTGNEESVEEKIERAFFGDEK